MKDMILYKVEKASQSRVMENVGGVWFDDENISFDKKILDVIRVDKKHMRLC